MQHFIVDMVSKQKEKQLNWYRENQKTLIGKPSYDLDEDGNDDIPDSLEDGQRKSQKRVFVSDKFAGGYSIT